MFALKNTHVHRIVFLDVHLASLQQWSVDLACFIPTFFRGFRRQRPPVENDSIGAMDGESDFRLPKRRRTRSRRNAVEHSTFSPDELRQVPTMLNVSACSNRRQGGLSNSNGVPCRSIPAKRAPEKAPPDTRDAENGNWGGALNFG